MIVEGNKIGDDIYAQLSDFFTGREVALGIVVAGDDPVIEQFVRIKARAAQRLGVRIVRLDCAPEAATADLIGAIEEIKNRVDGLIVQLPLPRDVDVNAVLSTIPANLDIDAINPRHSIERIVEAPVALAVVEILKRSNVVITGKRAVVIGAGRLVGKPTAALLSKLGAHVSIVTLEEGSIDDLKDADIIVSGAGQPGLITPERIKEGVALIDAGTSELNKKVVGDADPSCASKCSVFTPVPGGVGPVAVSMIFKNLSDLIARSS